MPVRIDLLTCARERAAQAEVVEAVGFSRRFAEEDRALAPVPLAAALLGRGSAAARRYLVTPPSSL